MSKSSKQRDGRMKVGYKRVSTIVQNDSRQLAELELERIFVDHASGKNTSERPQLQAMIEFIRDGDEVYVHSMDRLARNLKDLLGLVEQIRNKGASLHFLKENLLIESQAQQSPMTTLMLSMMGAFAEFERSLILERQREGIALAKQKGLYKGRKPVSKEKLEQAKDLLKQGQKVSAVARQTGLSRASLYKYLKPKTAVQLEI